MNQKQVIVKLRSLLDRADIDSDSIINRKVSSKHDSEIQVLLEHVSLLILDLKFDAEVCRRELFEVRALLEE